ncbi:WXG100 family type VII secretion target [Amycolatopsis sp. NPDC059021]|uniref:WXG100 family type VII secretion target n=1 Tax=Amycolatopsis sp. NPDC059021 TaxID=3346704 RepID=UPI00366AEAEE
MSSTGTIDSFEALGFDPAPGDLAQVSTIAEKYRTVATGLTDALESLQAIVQKKGEIWQGQASEAFARRVGKLPGYLDAAARSMTQAAQAVSRWEGDLGTLKAQARELEVKARQAAEAAQAARNNPDFALAGQTFPDEPSLKLAQNLLDDAGRKLQEAIDGCENIQEAAKRVLEQHGKIAQEVAAELTRARELAPEEPGLLDEVVGALTNAVKDFANDVADVADKIGNFVQDHANTIAKLSDVAGDIGNGLSVLSEALPPPVQEIVGGVATGLGVVALAGHASAKAAGAEVSDQTLIMDSIGAGTSLIGTLVPDTALAAKVLGYGAVDLQIFSETPVFGKRANKEGPIADFLNYWIPRNPSQAVSAAAGVLAPPLLAVHPAINAATDGMKEDSKLERREQLDRSRVWE